MAENNNNNKNNRGENAPRKPFNTFDRFLIGMILISIALYFFNASTGPKEISWLEFKREMLLEKEVQKVQVVNNEIAEVYLKPEALRQPEYEGVAEPSFGDSVATGPHFYFTIGSVETFENKLDEAQTDFEDEEVVPVTYISRLDWADDVLPWLIPIGLIILFWIFMMKRMQGQGGGNPFFNIGKSTAKLYESESKPKVKFDDVAGLEEAKTEVKEIVSFLRDMENYTRLGAKIPKGVLMVGPPGTGKTLMAKAVAGEADVPFFSISGSDFVEMFVGVGASRVRSLFDNAKKKAPCIIFIDEIDAIGRSRERAKSMQSNDEQENTLNQLLQELDGFENNSGVIVMGATNRQDVLDKALLRPGRFDRQIYLDFPNLQEREAMYKVHMQPIKVDDSVDTKLLASQSAGFSGADIANVCNEAALIAARHKREAVTGQDFMDAMDRIIAGMEKKSKVISDEEKKIIAYHEAGHAVISKLLKNVDALVKVSIIPRGKSLGANWYLPEEQQITTKTQMIDKMCAALAGRAAEDIIFNEVSSGALNDLERITKMAYTMVSMYGLDDKLGNVSYYDSTGQWNNGFQKPYSEYTGKIIDEEVHKIIRDAYERAKSLLKDHKEALDNLASLLLEKETIFAQDLDSIFATKKDVET